jgi:hypothetical protein
VVAVGNSLVTVQTAGRRVGVVNALVDAANAITTKDYPYVWGGGHAEAGVAGIGETGPGHNGKRVGFDCSGSVAAVLAGAGLWTPGSGVPADNGIISELLSEHLIAKGVGAAPDEVTLYDDPGVHIFINIEGRFFGTSDGGGGGDRKGGPGWLDDGAWDATSSAFKKYHFLASVLRNSTTYGNDYTFVLGPELSQAGMQRGDQVEIGYYEARSGAYVARQLTFLNSAATTGTITYLGPWSLRIQTTTGESIRYSVGILQSLLYGLVHGDTVSVLSSTVRGVLTAHTITVTATPPPNTGTTTTPTGTTTTPTGTTTTPTGPPPWGGGPPTTNY